MIKTTQAKLNDVTKMIAILRKLDLKKMVQDNFRLNKYRRNQKMKN